MVVSVWQSLPPLDTPQGCFQLAESIQSLENLSQARIFVGEEVEQTLGHISCSFSCTISRPPLPPAPLVLSLPSKHTNKTKSPSFLSEKNQTETHSNFAWTSLVLLSTQFCQHLFPLSVVKMQMPSSFLSLLLSLDNCETCYPFLGKVESFSLLALSKTSREQSIC